MTGKLGYGPVMKYTSIFFDWDGTLVNSLGVIVKAHNHVRVAFGLEPWEMIDYFGTASQSARDLYPKIYGDKAPDALKMVYAYLEEHGKDQTEPLDGAVLLLEALKKKGITMGVVSNKSHPLLNAEIKHMKWDRYFSAIVGAGYAKADKPNPDPLLIAIKEAGLPEDVSNLLYVGDTETDLRVAMGAGCDSALLLHGRTDMGALIDRFAPVYVTQNLPELHEALISP
jgi:phosphoglycolate phosphatase